MPRFLFISFTCVGLLTGCVAFPDLDGAISASGRVAAYPKLIPIDALVDQAIAGQGDAAAQGRWLAARAAALRRRARQLRAPVIDRRARRLMAAAVARHWPADGAPLQ
jgi:hypothetical protein